MSVTKRSLRILRNGIILVLIGCMVNMIPHVFLVRNICGFYFITLAMLLVIRFSTGIIDRRLRVYLTGIAVLICLWILFRDAKYFIFKQTAVIARYLWYAYYIPMLYIPDLSLKAAWAVGIDEGKKLPQIRYVIDLITFLLVAIVLTNDIHQKIFMFHPGFEDWDGDYSYRTAGSCRFYGCRILDRV